jgi:hypothetical protein
MLNYEELPPAEGECKLRISAPGFATCEISVYIPSDFVGNLATLLKKENAKAGGNQNR